MKSFRNILIRVVLALLIATLLCWPGIGRAAGAQEDTTSPSFDFRADPIVVEAREEGEPPARVIVSNGDGTGLEFSAEVEGSQGLLRMEAASSLGFLEDPLALKIEDEEEVVANVVVRNDSDRIVDLVFSTLLMDANGDQEKVNFEPQRSTSARANSVTPVKLKVDTKKLETLSMPLEGYLVVSDKEGQVAPGTLSLTVSEVEVRPAILKDKYILGRSVDTYNLVLIAPFAVALVLVFICYFDFYFRKKGDRRRTDGNSYVPLSLVGRGSAFGTGLALDPKSWASLSTIAAGLLTASTGAEIFLEVRGEPFTEEEVTGLALAFGGLLVFAPAVYNGIRWRSPEPLEDWPGEQENPEGPEAPAPSKEPDRQGYILPLLLASAIISGALLGQLVLAFLLVNEVDNAAMTPIARCTMFGVVAGAAAYALVYTWTGVRSCLKEKIRWEKEREGWEQKVCAEKKRLEEGGTERVRRARQGDKKVVARRLTML